MTTDIKSVHAVKCEQIDDGSFFRLMRLEYSDGSFSWYRANPTGFDNINEVVQAEQEKELEAVYVLFKAAARHEPGHNEGSEA